jgi:pimeloyl-ACP methyl ester carboxylesterase
VLIWSWSSAWQRTVIDRQLLVVIPFARAGPPLLLLHGFPETHLMWRDVAPLQARYFTVVCADLRGYGCSGFPDSTPDHAPYSKRSMARDMKARKTVTSGLGLFGAA